MMKRIDDCIKDCEASLALDQVGQCQKIKRFFTRECTGLSGRDAAEGPMSHGDQGVGGGRADL